MGSTPRLGMGSTPTVHEQYAGNPESSTRNCGPLGLFGQPGEQPCALGQHDPCGQLPPATGVLDALL